MATIAHLLHAPLPCRPISSPTRRFSALPLPFPSNSSPLPQPQHLSLPRAPNPFKLCSSAANADLGFSSSVSAGAGNLPSKLSTVALGVLGLLLTGWRSRVLADPQFPFKVLMEELVGVTACVLGDMATRPNFGLNELDFVFSTLVVGSILNFLLMYILAPTASTSAAVLPSIFAGCPAGHMFEPGAFGLAQRLGTFVYKGLVFAAVGFAAGLLGTAISNGLIAMRKRMDPSFETQNEAPPTMLNATTWAAHMGVSSNLRYQGLNGIEFLLEGVLPPVVFKASVLVMRLLNNVLGGMTFVMLAKFTGAQKSGDSDGEDKQ